MEYWQSYSPVIKAESHVSADGDIGSTSSVLALATIAAGI